MNWIDLSLPVYSGMPVYPGDPAVQIEPVLNHDRHHLQVSRLTMGSHTGTHLDAPRHFLSAGDDVSQLPLEKLMGPAYVATCPWHPDRPLDLAAIDLSSMLPGDMLLLSTGWESQYGLPDYFENVPVFASGSTEYLKKLGIHLLGLDMPTVSERSDPPSPYAMHIGLLQSGILLVEGLAGLMPLRGKRVEFQALPLRLDGCDGSPVRACARLLG